MLEDILILQVLGRGVQLLLITGGIAFAVMFVFAVLSFLMGYYWTLGRHRGLVKALRERESTEELNHGT